MTATAGGDRSLLPGSSVPCTAAVLERLARIPVASVRRVVATKVAERARAEGAALVDVALFERAATF